MSQPSGEKYFLRYWVWKSETRELELDTENELYEQIDELIKIDPRMTLEVFYGKKLELKPTEVLKTYRIEKGNT